MMEVLGFVKLALKVLVIGLCVGSEIIGDGSHTLKLTKHKKNKKVLDK